MTFWLLIEIKHFICDYWLQTLWMWEGKRAAYNWVAPLFTHSLINALGTFTVVCCINPPQAGSALILDLAFHAAIDRAKPSVEEKFGYKFATLLDQGLHQLTYLGIYLFLVL